jgi:hypothetical protein
LLEPDWQLYNAAGACYHALGFHRSAARDYSAAFAIEEKDSSNETKMQQFLSFYQVCLHVSACHACPHSCSIKHCLCRCKIACGSHSMPVTCARCLQRELALYTYHNLDRKFSTYFMDKDISPVFKGVRSS